MIPDDRQLVVHSYTVKRQSNHKASTLHMLLFSCFVHTRFRTPSQHTHPCCMAMNQCPSLFPCSDCAMLPPNPHSSLRDPAAIPPT